MPIITTPRRPTSQRPAGRSNNVDDTCCCSARRRRAVCVAAAAVPVVDRDLRRRSRRAPRRCTALTAYSTRSLGVVALDGITDERLDEPPHAHRRQAERQQRRAGTCRTAGRRGWRSRPAWLTWSLDVSPRANWIARTPEDQVQDALGRRARPARADRASARATCSGTRRHAASWSWRAGVPATGDGEPSCRVHMPMVGTIRAASTEDATLPSRARSNRAAARRRRPRPRPARRSPCPGARRRRRCSPRSPRPTCRGTRIDVWQVDERVAPDGHPDRNANQLAGFPGRHHLMPVTAADLAAARRRYAAGLPDRFDVVHLGIGADGHTASWPPGDPVVDSDASGRPLRRVQRTGADDADARASSTPPSAGSCSITGADKAPAVAALAGTAPTHAADRPRPAHRHRRRPRPRRGRAASTR